MRARLLAWLLGVPLLIAAPGAASPPFPIARAAPRIVAVGDIHGAASGLVQILQAAGLIDPGQRWIGGSARLVQTGDFLDRGADVRAVMDLLMRLEEEARRSGGRVDVLFGNHEGMNVLHDFRDVADAAFASFADARSEERQRRAYERHAGIAAKGGGSVAREAWTASHPRGWVEYAEALGPSGRYGRWIRSKKAVLQIGDTIFMHAGLHPERTITIDDINRTVEREVRAWDDLVGALDRAGVAAPFFSLQEIVGAAQVEIGRIGLAQKTSSALPEYVTPDFVRRLQFLQGIDKLALVESDGPLWYRGLATLPDTDAPAVTALLQRHRARRIVIGHTPQLPGRIRPRFDGAVVLIDTGMLASHYKGGQPSALEISGDTLRAIYPGGPQPLPVSSASR